jgi:hypothetical protein
LVLIKLYTDNSTARNKKVGKDFKMPTLFHRRPSVPGPGKSNSHNYHHHYYYYYYYYYHHYNFLLCTS